MEAFAKQQLQDLAAGMNKRRAQLRAEIRQALARSNKLHYTDLLNTRGNAGDGSVPTMLRDVAEPEVVRGSIVRKPLRPRYTGHRP